MADRPHRAIVLFGDGLVRHKVRSPPPGSSAIHLCVDELFSLDDARCPHLDTLCSEGCSGLLALRQIPGHCSEEEQVLVELAQLFDVYHSSAWQADGSEGNAAAEVPSLSERFMGMSAIFLTNFPPALALAEKIGFTALSFSCLSAQAPIFPHVEAHPSTPPSGLSSSSSTPPLPPTAPHSFSAAERQQEQQQERKFGSSWQALPDVADFANRLVAALGLDKEEMEGPPPNSSEVLKGEFDMAFVHLHAGSLIQQQRQQQEGKEKVPDGTALYAPSDEGAAQTGEVTIWDAAIVGIQWLDEVTASLLSWRKVPGRKAQQHMLLVLIMGFGGQAKDRGGIELLQEKGGVSGGQPSGEKAEREEEEEEEKMKEEVLQRLRPRQSYCLKGNKDVDNVRRTHPLLFLQHLPGVTREDEAQLLRVREIQQRCGSLAILADRFLHEITFKLWRSGKYGA